MVLKAATIALTILAGCDFAVCDGQYTNSMLQVLTARPS